MKYKGIVMYSNLIHDIKLVDVVIDNMAPDGLHLNVKKNNKYLVQAAGL